MSVIVIDRKVPFDPSKFIGPGWTIAQGEEDEYSLALTKIDVASIVPIWPEDEGVRVTGEDELIRLRRLGCVMLDDKTLQTFWQDKSSIPEYLFKIKTEGNATAFIFFDGTPLIDPYGRRFVLCFFFSYADNDWHVLPCPLSVDRRIFGPSATYRRPS